MILDVVPVPKVRMVRSDSWRKRPCVLRYWQYKDDLNIEAKKNGYEIGEILENITFVLPMPNSWSKKKKLEMNGNPHKQRPDLDNLIKGFQDCLCSEDSHIHKINSVCKVWGEKGEIRIDL